MGLPEKLEECPVCGEDGKNWNYDFQRCTACGYPMKRYLSAISCINPSCKFSERICKEIVCTNSSVDLCVLYTNGYHPNELICSGFREKKEEKKSESDYSQGGEL